MSHAHCAILRSKADPTVTVLVGSSPYQLRAFKWQALESRPGEIILYHDDYWDCEPAAPAGV